jgi:ceramide glucosyltransferase
MSIWRWMILVAAIGPYVYYLLATYCGWEYFRKVRKLPAPDPSFAPPVSILKPVRGVDREAYENFSSFCRLDYPDYEIVFAVSDVDDPVIPVIERLQRDYPDRQIRLLTRVPPLGANSKVNKLCLLSREAQHDLMVISDSDVRVESDYLREMTAPFVRTEVGAVTALFRGIPGGSFFSELDALGVPSESGPSALVARKLEGNMKFAFGWSMATTKKHLAEIGGFEAMANHHSDDFELGNRIASKGYRVELMRKWVWIVFPNESMEEFLRHELRWSIGLRNVRKLGYLGLGLTYGLPWVVLAAIAAPSRGIAAAYMAAYVGLRLAMAWTVGVWGIGDPVTRRRIWLVPLRDLANFGVWLAGFFSNTIYWRGLVFRVRQGLLIPVLGAGHAGPKIEARVSEILSSPKPNSDMHQPITEPTVYTPLQSLLREVD